MSSPSSSGQRHIDSFFGAKPSSLNGLSNEDPETQQEEGRVENLNVEIATLPLNSTPSFPKTEQSHEKKKFCAELANGKWPLRDPSIEDFDIIEMHAKLELIEHRIRQGHDKLHTDPALSVYVLKTEGIGEADRGEERTRDNYYSNKVMSSVPTFWEPRVYDQPCELLDDAATKSLQETIKLCTADSQYSSRVVTRRQTWNPNRPRKYQSDSSNGSAFD